jgi:hypothetical protein
MDIILFNILHLLWLWLSQKQFVEYIWSFPKKHKAYGDLCIQGHFLRWLFVWLKTTIVPKIFTLVGYLKAGVP